MSEITRREALSRLALAIATAGTVDRLAAQDVHHIVQQAATASGGRYAPKALSAHEFQTLERLTDLIIPADNGKPGAVQADVAAWIDTLLDVNSELKARYTSGLAWLDRAMTERGATDFVSAAASKQTELLDVIAFQRNRSRDLNAGIDFFILARRMTADGFYTSAIGMRDVYLGNAPQAAFTVPAAAMDHVLSRSPLK
jgi:gluconate 2-dehydrogenase gamma chain